MAKSAMDRMKELSNKELIKRGLGCPQHYGLTGIYTDPSGGCVAGGDKSMCYTCWTKRI